VRKGVRDFETGAKMTFRDASTKSMIDIGSTRFSHAELGVKRGRMALHGGVVEEFFRPCVDQIVTSIQDQMAGLHVEHILLVGGFGERQYLRETLNRTFGTEKCHIVNVNDSTSKAVSDGAVIWHTKRSVVARACRFSYGISSSLPHDHLDPRQFGRPVTKVAGGVDLVNHNWWPLVKRGDIQHADKRIVNAMFRTYDSPNLRLSGFELDIYAFTLTDGTDPYWLFDSDGKLTAGFEKICTIVGNLNKLRGALIEKSGPDGPYWQLNFKAVMNFSETTLQACIEWEEQGITRRGKVLVIPESLA